MTQEVLNLRRKFFMKIQRFAALCLVILVLVPSSCSRSKGLEDVLREEIPRLMDVSDIPGLSIAVIREGEIFRNLTVC